MTHGELARRIAQREAISIKDARRVLDAVALEIKAGLQRGEHVVIAGLGTLKRSETGARRTTFRSSSSRTPAVRPKAEADPAAAALSAPYDEASAANSRRSGAGDEVGHIAA